MRKANALWCAPLALGLALGLALALGLELGLGLGLALVPVELGQLELHHHIGA